MSRVTTNDRPIGQLRAILHPLHQHRRFLWPVAVAVLFTYGYFIGTPGWNQNSRLALTRAIVEQGTTVIDRYHETTGDKSFRDGHFYSDKAPGASLLAVPAYALFYATRKITGGELPDVRVSALDPLDDAIGRAPDLAMRAAGDTLFYNHSHKMAMYVCALTTSTLVAMIGVAALWLLVLRQVAGDVRTAVMVVLVYALATPALVYSSAFYGHQLCADFLLIAFAVLVLMHPGKHTHSGLLVAGAALGLAVLCEYPAVVPAALLAGYAVRRHAATAMFWLAIGALPFASILAWYHHVSFGNPFTTGYAYVHLPEFAEGMRLRYGIGLPDATVLTSIMFGSYRGLFYLSPVLLLATWGLVRACLRGDACFERLAAVSALGIVVFYLLLNASYYMWDGGAALGPRHCVPMLPFLVLGLAAPFAVVSRACIVLAMVSGVQMLLAAAASPEAPRHGNPLWEFAIPRLLDVTSSGAGNLGHLLGLPSMFSLMPLCALWLWVWLRVLRVP